MKLFEVFGEITLKGQRAVTNGLESIDDRAGTTGSKINRLGSRMESLGNTVSGVGGTMSKWVTGPLAAAGAGMAALTNKAINTTQELRNQANVAKQGVEEFQKSAFAAQTVGIEQEKLSDIFKDAGDKIGDFNANQAGPLKDFFEKIAPQVGVTAEEFKGLSGKDAMQLYVNSLEKANVGQQEMTFYMEALASDATKLLPLLRNNGEEMRRLGNEAERSGLVLSESMIKSTNKAEADMAKFGTALDVVTVQLGSALIPVMESLVPVLINSVVPALKSAAGFIEGMATAFGALPQPIQSLIVSLTGLAAALGPVLFVGGKLVATFGKLLPLLLRAGAVMKTLGVVVGVAKAAALALGAALAPFAATIAAIIAAVVAAIAIFKNWDTITAALGATMDAIAAGIKAAWKGIKQAGKALWAWVKTLPQKFKQAWNSISSFVVDAAKGVRNAWNSIIDGGVQLVKWLMGMPGRFAEALSSAASQVKQFVQSVISFFQSLPGKVVQAVKNMAMGVVNWVKDMASNVISDLQSMANAVVGNSIIPDMAEDVNKVMGGMAEEGGKQAGNFNRNVQRELDGIQAPESGNMAAQSGRGGTQGGGNTTVDMRHSVFRDDKDMLDRLRRSGMEMTGAF